MSWGFVKFELCDSQGKPVPSQHPIVYLAVRFIQRVVKMPGVDNVSYIDMGGDGYWVKGDFNKIAVELTDSRAMQDKLDVAVTALQEIAERKPEVTERNVYFIRNTVMAALKKIGINIG